MFMCMMVERLQMNSNGYLHHTLYTGVFPIDAGIGGWTWPHDKVMGSSLLSLPPPPLVVVGISPLLIQASHEESKEENIRGAHKLLC